MGSNLIVLDVETTGIPSKRACSYKDSEAFENARMIELGYVVLSADGQQLLKERSVLVRSVDRVENSEIHGITTLDLIERGISIEEALEMLEKDLVGVGTIVAHNIAFDTKILQSEMYRCKGNSKMIDDFVGKAKICTMLYGKEIMGVRKWPKLTELYSFLTGENLLQTHRALDDVRATVKCFRMMFAPVINSISSS
jgi:DNA polymerase III epsilon subunit-like protein